MGGFIKIEVRIGDDEIFWVGVWVRLGWDSGGKWVNVGVVWFGEKGEWVFVDEFLELGRGEGLREGGILEDGKGFGEDVFI